MMVDSCEEDGFYPNVDFAIWLRSCTNETEAPLEGRIKGKMPRYYLKLRVSNSC